MIQPSARLNLRLMCISLWRYSVQYFTFERVYLRLALQCTLTLILLFYSISAYYLCYFTLFKSHWSVPVISPLYYHMMAWLNGICHTNLISTVCFDSGSGGFF